MSSPAVLAAVSLTQSAKAQLYWDINGTTASGNSTTAAAGTWDTVTSNWNTVADGTGATGLWSGGTTPVTAVFSAGTSVTGAYGITISGTITGVNGITFEEGNVNLNTGTLTLTAPTITANAATSTISGILAGNVGLTKAGTGLVVLSGANTYTGNTLISAGALRFSTAASFAGTPGTTVTLGGTSAVAGFGYGTFSQADLNRFTSGSTGTVALAFGAGASTPISVPLDFSAATGANLGNVYLGALSGNNATVSGVITPFGNTYRFGSGGGTLVVATTLTAGNSISIGNGVTSGTVSFSGAVTNQTTADPVLNTLGTLVVSSDTDLGDNITAPAQAVQFNGGILSITGSPTITHNMAFNTGAGTINASTSGGAVTLSGTISGTTAFTKGGAGKLVLTGNYSGYTGAATVTAGSLEVDGVFHAPTVALTGGSLGGVGSVSNGGTSVVTVNAAGHLVPGLGTALAGNPTFTVDNLTLATTTSFIDERLDTNGVNDVVNVSGTNGLSITGGGFNLSTATIGDLVAGNSYTLLTYAGTPLTSTQFGGLFVNAGPAGFEYTLHNDTANNRVTVSLATSAGGISTWNLDGNGSWTPTSNWLNGSPNGVDASAVFGNVISASRTVTLDAAKTVGTLTFDNANRYALVGTAALTMNVSSGSAAINILSGSHTISTPITLSDPTTLTVNGPAVTFGGVITGAGIAMTQAGTGSVTLTAKPTALWVMNSGKLFATIANMPASVTLNGNSAISFGVGAASAGTGTYAGVISGTSTTSSAASGGVAGGGAFTTTTLTANNTFQGTFYSAEQTLQLGGAAGALSGASTIDMFKGSLLLNNGTNNNDRLGASTAVNLRGAQFSYTGNAAGSTETFGNLILSPDGLNYFTITPNTVGDTVTAASLVRNPGGALFVRGTGLATSTGAFSQLKFITPPTVTGSGATITPLTGVIADTSSTANGLTATLTTYDPTLGVRQLATTEYSSTAVTNTNYAPTAAATAPSGITLNAIELGGGGNVASTAGIAVTFAGTNTITSGMILSTSTSTSTLAAGTLAFGTSAGAGEAIIGAYGGSLTVNSVISSTGMTKVGNATLSLTGSNNFHSGPVAIDQGILIVNSTARLNGASLVDIGNTGYIDSAQGYKGGALQLTSATGNYTMPLIMNGNFFGGTPTFSTTPGTLESAGGVNTWSGAITFNNNEANTANNLYNILSATSGSTLVLSGTISAGVRPDGSTELAGLMTYGQGDIVFTGASPNSFSNFVRPLGGRLILEKDAAFGSNGFQAGLGIFFGTTTATQASIAFRAPSSSPAGFNYATQQVIQYGGTGVGANGVFLANLGGANTFAGILNMDSEYALAGYNNPFRVDIASGSLELSGAITARFASPRDILKQGVGQLVFSSNNNIVPVVSGTTIGMAFGTGSKMDILAGGVTVTGATGELPSGYTSFVIREGTNLTLDNSRGVDTNRINSTATVNLTGLGAELKLVGNATTPVTQSMGNISIASYSTVTAQSIGAGTELDLPGFDASTARSHNGTVLLRGMDNSSSFIKFVTAPTLVGGGGSGTLTSILPSAVGDTSASGLGTDFVTVQGNFARVLAPSEYKTLVTHNAAPDNVTAVPADNGGSNNIATFATTMGAQPTTEVNAIKITGGTTISIASGARLWAFSGAILGVGTATSTIVGGNLAFEQYYPTGDINQVVNSQTGAFASDLIDTNVVGISDGAIAGTAQEGIITVPTGSTLIQDSSNVISGAAGLTKSGGGTLRLLGNNTVGGTKAFYYFNGFSVDTIDATAGSPLTINAGRLEFNVDANLGYASSPIFINGGTLAPLSSSTSARAINLASLGSNIVDVGAGGDFSTSGQVTGNALTKNGTGTLGLLNISNNYSGGTTINAGNIRIVPTAAAGHPELGTGTVTLNGGSIEADDNTIFDRNIVATNTTNTTGGFYILPGKTLTFGATSASTSAITGAGNLAIDGGGKLILANINGNAVTHSGRYYINNGSTLELIPNDLGKVTAAIGNPPGGFLWQVTNDSTLQFALTPVALGGFAGSTAGIQIGNTTGTGGNGNVDVVGTNTVTTNGALSGTGTLTKAGTGELSFRASPIAGNSGFSGKFIVSNGTLSVGDQGIALTGGNSITLLGMGSDTGATPFMQVYGNTEFLYRPNSLPLTMKSNQSIMLTDDVTHTLPALGTTGSSFTINGVIKSDPTTPALGLQLDARGGSIVLAGASTYSGDTFIKTLAATGGTGSVRTGIASALPSTTIVHFDAQSATGSSILDLSPAGTTTAFNQTVAGIINDTTATLTTGVVKITNTSATASATLNVNNATDDTFSGNLVGTTLNIGHSSAGTLVLTGTASVFGGLDGTGNTTIGNGPGITVSANHFRQNTLTITANSTAKANAVASLTDATQSAAGVSRVSTLAIGTGAKLDLTNTKLIVAGGSQTGTWNVGTSSYDGITGLVQKGRNGGTWDGTGGIITSQTNALGGPSSLTTLAVASNADLGKTTFAGQAVTSTDTLVMYTYNGDANLDGRVDADDYFQIDSNYNKSGPTPGSGTAFGFNKGDFNYDGHINGDDYFLIDSAYLAKGANIAHGSPTLDAGASVDGLSGVSAVPEPGTISLLSLAAMSYFGRRRRK